MIVPDGPAVAYALARQPDLVQRLNTLPPPLVLVELGKSQPPALDQPVSPAVGSTNGNGTALHRPARCTPPKRPSPAAGLGHRRVIGMI